MIAADIPRRLPAVLPSALQTGDGRKQGKTDADKNRRGKGYDALLDTDNYVLGTPVFHLRRSVAVGGSHAHSEHRHESTHATATPPRFLDELPRSSNVAGTQYPKRVDGRKVLEVLSTKGNHMTHSPCRFGCSKCRLRPSGCHRCRLNKGWEVAFLRLDDGTTQDWWTATK